jgi:uncharacterized protein (DUF2141 family)
MMNLNARVRNQVGVAFVLAVAAVLAASSAAMADGKKARVTVEATGLRSAKGVVRCALFASAQGFPTDGERAVRTTAPSIANGRATCTFEDVKPGTYAVVYLHDENNNGKMDTDVIGRPTEGRGASNDARGTLGPPKFDDAKFKHDGETTLRLKTEY